MWRVQGTPVFARFLGLLTAVVDMVDLLVIACKTLVTFVTFVVGRLGQFAKGCDPVGVHELQTAFNACLLLKLRFLVTSSVLGAMLRPALGRLTVLKKIIMLHAVLSIFLGGRVGRLRARGNGSSRPWEVCCIAGVLGLGGGGV